MGQSLTDSQKPACIISSYIQGYDDDIAGKAQEGSCSRPPSPWNTGKCVLITILSATGYYYKSTFKRIQIQSVSRFPRTLMFCKIQYLRASLFQNESVLGFQLDFKVAQLFLNSGLLTMKLTPVIIYAKRKKIQNWVPKVKHLNWYVQDMAFGT